MAKVLLEDVSPLGNVQAIVECDERTCYFYLCGAEGTDLGVKSVWVRNLVAAPIELDVAAMRNGQPPLNPRKHCRNGQAAPPPLADSLRVVWLPEGNGAALFESNSLVAAIPPWSGREGFNGYARDCVGQGPLAWDLLEASAWIARVQEAEAFRRAWTERDTWSALSDRLTNAVEAQLGPRSNYYAIDGGNWPPRAMLRIPRKDCTILITVGMCILPQPNVELSTDEPGPLRRVELAAALPLKWNNDDIMRFGSYISGQAGMPWQQFTWLGHGHTIPCDSWPNPTFTAAMLVNNHPAIGSLCQAEYLGDPVTTLWFLPISRMETKLAENQGSQALLQKLSPSRWSMA